MAVEAGLDRHQVSLYYFGHVFRLHAGIPNVVRVDEDDRTFLVATGACVAEHGGRREAAPLYLVPEHREQFAAALGAAASVTRCGAHEDLAQLRHAQILCGVPKKSRRSGL